MAANRSFEKQTRHRVLVVGAGSIGQRHIRCLLKTERADVSLCDSDASVRERVADQYGIREVFEDFERVAESSPNAAFIAELRSFLNWRSPS